MPESLTAYLSLVSALTVIYTGLSRRLLARASNKRSTPVVNRGMGKTSVLGRLTGQETMPTN